MISPFFGGVRPLTHVMLVCALLAPLSEVRAEMGPEPKMQDRLDLAPGAGARDGEALAAGTQSGLAAPRILNRDAPPSEADRHKLLLDLYARLETSADVESAGIIAEAIEKLWLRSGSDTVDLLMARAVVLVHAKDFEVALKILNTVVELAPKYSEGWNQRATVHFLKGEYQNSLEDLRRVLTLDPMHFKAISGLGLIMQELGDKRAALKAFRKALKIHPHLDDAQQAERELTRDVEGQGI